MVMMALIGHVDRPRNRTEPEWSSADVYRTWYGASPVL